MFKKQCLVKVWFHFILMVHIRLSLTVSNCAPTCQLAVIRVLTDCLLNITLYFDVSTTYNILTMINFASISQLTLNLPEQSTLRVSRHVVVN